MNGPPLPALHPSMCTRPGSFPWATISPQATAIHSPAYCRASWLLNESRNALKSLGLFPVIGRVAQRQLLKRLLTGRGAGPDQALSCDPGRRVRAPGQGLGMGCPGAREGAAGSPPFLGPPRSPLACPLGNGARRRSRAPCGAAAGRPGPAAAKARRDRLPSSRLAAAMAPRMRRRPGRPHFRLRSVSPLPCMAAFARMPDKVAPCRRHRQGRSAAQGALSAKVASPPRTRRAAGMHSRRRDPPFPRASHVCAGPDPGCGAGAIARNNRWRKDARIAGQGLAAHPTACSARRGRFSAHLWAPGPATPPPHSAHGGARVPGVLEFVIRLPLNRGPEAVRR